MSLRDPNPVNAKQPKRVAIVIANPPCLRARAGRLASGEKGTPARLPVPMKRKAGLAWALGAGSTSARRTIDCAFSRSTGPIVGRARRRRDGSRPLYLPTASRMAPIDQAAHHVRDDGCGRPRLGIGSGRSSELTGRHSDVRWPRRSDRPPWVQRTGKVPLAVDLRLEPWPSTRSRAPS